MPIVFLDNTARRYDWGSRDAIPTLLGTEPDGEPLAELWLGAHDSAPSRLLSDSLPGDLAAWVAADPEAVLGPRVRVVFGDRLPFLLKILAAERALSIQAHPSPAQAREGFARENAAGVALDAPWRNYRDDAHKPEMVFALTEFNALMGVRPLAESATLLAALVEAARGAGQEGFWEEVRAALSSGGAEPVLALLLGRAEEARAVLEAALAHPPALVDVPSPVPVWELMSILAEQYPGDPGVLVALLLNPVRLAPGETMAMPAGNIHAYLSGVAVEIMASSDNVLRAGLTSKHVDIEELRSVADFAPLEPRLVPNTGEGAHQVFAPGVPDFSLHVIDAGETLLPRGPAIALCLDGDFTLTAGDESARLLRGQSVVLAHDLGEVRCQGRGRLVVGATGAIPA